MQLWTYASQILFLSCSLRLQVEMRDISVSHAVLYAVLDPDVGSKLRSLLNKLKFRRHRLESGQQTLWWDREVVGFTTLLMPSHFPFSKKILEGTMLTQKQSWIVLKSSTKLFYSASANDMLSFATWPIHNIPLLRSFVKTIFSQRLFLQTFYLVSCFSPSSCFVNLRPK